MGRKIGKDIISWIILTAHSIMIFAVKTPKYSNNPAYDPWAYMTL